MIIECFKWVGAIVSVILVGAMFWVALVGDWHE